MLAILFLVGALENQVAALQLSFFLTEADASEEPVVLLSALADALPVA